MRQSFVSTACLRRGQSALRSRLSRKVVVPGQRTGARSWVARAPTQRLRFWTADWSWMHEERVPRSCKGGVELAVPAHWDDVEIELNVSHDPFHFAIDRPLQAVSLGTPPVNRIVLEEHELPY